MTPRPGSAPALREEPTPVRPGNRPPARSARVVEPPAPRRPVVSLRLVAPLLAAALLTVAVTGAAVISERNARTTLVRELHARLLLEARTLATASAGALLGEFPELTLHPMAREIAATRKELPIVVVLDHKGVVQGHPDARQLGVEYVWPLDLRPASSEVTLRQGEELLENRTLLLAQAPVEPPSGGRIGTTLVGIQRSYLDSALADSRREQSLLLLAVLVFGIVLTFGLMSLLLRPIAVLRQGLERIGRGDLETPIDARDPTELGMLADTVNRMAARLKVAQQETVEKERLAREVELARSIQRSLLPQGRMVAGGFELEGAQRAATEVGGDYFDLLTLSKGRIGITIADVSGKGLAGCLVMSMLSALLRALRHAYVSPAQLLIALEETLVQSLSRGGFVTMFYGVLDPATGRLVFASAGHTPMLIYRAAQRVPEWHRARAVPIGAVRTGALKRMLSDETVDLAPGDVAVHFTDGFSEAAHRETGEQFGFDRIAAVVQRSSSRGPKAVIDALAVAVSEWTGTETPQDDETVLVIARELTASADPVREPQASPPETVATEPLAWLAEARSTGQSLTLTARLEDLVMIRGWLENCTDLGQLNPRALRLLESALYELSANIVEHGYGLAPGRSFDLWWVAAPGDAGPKLADRVRNGYLLIHDRGKVFKPPHRPLLDFNDPRVRRKGRGIGLDLIRRILSEISYHPGTSEGNLTRLVFDPTRMGDVPEERHE